MPLPDWLTEPTPPSPAEAGRMRKSWLSGAISKFAALSTRLKIDRNSGMLRIDPRAALSGFIVLIISTTLLTNPLSLVICWLIAIIFAKLAGTGIQMVLRTSLAFGMLTTLMMLPAMTNLVTQGEQLVDLGPISITAPGVTSLAVVTLKTMACFGFGIGLFASNKPEDLFEALRAFRVPGIFIAMVLLTYRYLQVVIRATLEIHYARKSRIAAEIRLSGARNWLGEQAGALFSRSLALGNEVHASMTARGFDSEWIPSPRTTLMPRDIGLMIICITLAAVLFVIDHGWLA